MRSSGSDGRTGSSLVTRRRQLHGRVTALRTRLSRHRRLCTAGSGIIAISDGSAAHNTTTSCVGAFHRRIRHINGLRCPTRTHTRNVANRIHLVIVVGRSNGVGTVHLLRDSGSAVLSRTTGRSMQRTTPFNGFARSVRSVIRLHLVHACHCDSGMSIACWAIGDPFCFSG